MRLRLLGLVVLSALVLTAKDDRLRGAFRKPADHGWIFVHLEGSPAARGFQHGYLLSAEIQDAKRAIELSATHDASQHWSQLRAVAEKIS